MAFSSDICDMFCFLFTAALAYKYNSEQPILTQNMSDLIFAWLDRYETAVISHTYSKKLDNET